MRVTSSRTSVYHRTRRERIVIVSRTLALLAAVAVGLWAALGSPAGIQAQTPAVTIQDFAFKPVTLTIAVGTKVTWTNRDSTVHTSTSDSGVWDSSTLSQGQSYGFTFQQAGTYPY